MHEKIHSVQHLWVPETAAPDDTGNTTTTSAPHLKALFEDLRLQNWQTLAAGPVRDGEAQPAMAVLKCLLVRLRLEYAALLGHLAGDGGDGFSDGGLEDGGSDSAEMPESPPCVMYECPRQDIEAPAAFMQPADSRNARLMAALAAERRWKESQGRG